MHAARRNQDIAERSQCYLHAIGVRVPALMSESRPGQEDPSEIGSRGTFA